MSSLKPAQRLEEKQGFDVWSFINNAAAASPIQPICNMGQGFYGYNPPKFVLDAARETVDRTDTHQYAPTTGRLRLKTALAATYSPLFGKALDPATEILITTGANEGIFCALLAFIEPGDEVIIIEPFFDFYSGAIALAGGVVKYVSMETPVDGATNGSEWILDANKVAQAIGPRTKALIINSPHNPTGKILSHHELQPIADLCVRHSILIISDEVYDRLNYVPFTRIATLSPEVYDITLTVTSAGKTFYATGWRVGHVVGPARLVELVAVAHRGICYSSPSPSQEAIAISYEQADQNGFWEETRKDIEAKVLRFNQIWDELGITYTVPQGGYYIVINTNRIQIPKDFILPPHVTSREKDYHISYFMTQKLGIAALPMSEFYSDENKHKAAGLLRFAVCKPNEVLDLAKERLRGLKAYLK